MIVTNQKKIGLIKIKGIFVSMRDINIHVDYVKLNVNMANKNITVKFVWVVLYANIKDGDTFAKNAMEKVFVNMVNRGRFVLLAEE